MSGEGVAKDSSRASATSNATDHAQGDFQWLIGWILERPDACARTLIVAVALILAWHTWGRWGSIQIDSGRELYVPVEILRGKLIYRDIWYPHGPLTSYITAGLIWLFGKRLEVLYIFGITLGMSSALLLYQIGLLLSERGAGLLAALAVVVQGFSPGIFNYGFPYAYTAPMGMFLSFVCVLFLARYALTGRAFDVTIAATSTALALLTKQEMGLGSLLVLVSVVAVNSVIQGSVGAALRSIMASALGLGFAIVGYGWLFWKVGVSFILFDNWQLTPGSYFMRTYGAAWMGKVGLRLAPGQLLDLIFGCGLILFVWYLAARLLSKLSARDRLLLCLILALIGLVVRQSGQESGLVILATVAFPAGMFFADCGFLLYQVLRLSKGPFKRMLFAEGVVAASSLVFGIRIMAEVIPYGYAIFYDGLMFLVFAIIVRRYAVLAVPQLAPEKKRGLGNWLLAMDGVLLAVCVVPGTNYRSVPLKTDWGKIYLQPAEARIAGQILTFMNIQKRAHREVVVLPEGHAMYAFSGTEAPDRWESLIPGILSPQQEPSYIADLARTRPPYIILTNRNTAEYGAPCFGRDYNQEIYDWIIEHYRVVGQFGMFRCKKGAPLAGLLYEMDSNTAERAGSAQDSKVR